MSLATDALPVDADDLTATALGLGGAMLGSATGAIVGTLTGLYVTTATAAVLSGVFAAGGALLGILFAGLLTGLVD